MTYGPTEYQEVKLKSIWLIIPCYNEEEVLQETSKQLKIIMERMIAADKITKESRIVFVNDGSKDKTWEIIRKLHEENPIFAGINLSKNRGHQNALLAGLLTAKNYADALISLDADLQDDVSVIEKFIDEFYLGHDVVYGVRSSRRTDTFFKKFTAESFYKVMKLLGVNIVFNHADYRLMSKRALEGLNEFEESNIFLRGIIPLIGYPSTTVEYERHERFAGESKYPLKKMLSFAFDGITSFSIKPIRMILNSGILMFLVSIVIMLWSLMDKISGNTVPGWTSLIISIWMIGGIQLISIGFVGEYIGKIYEETKKRPRFIIESFLRS